MSYKNIAAGVLFLSICHLSIADDDACTRSTCDRGHALTYSPKDEPAIACDSLAVCDYVRFYLRAKFLESEGIFQPGDSRERTMERLRKRAKVDSFEDASIHYFQPAHHQKVDIRQVDFTNSWANVAPLDGTPSYWIDFEQLVRVKKTADSFANNEAPSRGSAVLAALVNGDTGIYAFDYLERKPGALQPQSFDENIAFAIDEVAPQGGQIFICSTKRNCDAIYAYYDALISLAGPYLYRSRDGKVVAQLNSGLRPDTAKAFESALKKLK
ncbi:hypothetical protein [Collimonas sp.]|jgi:hypothetical protein|uniref:hypothetical protein n=1 Tax=Collimonas sp. TaxID=1963772 RepID=UPI002CEDF8FC|nr:hypothetical protein [Collimonas sp.]HWX02493.1 hypothetical protein [Collimonas sp.]